MSGKLIVRLLLLSLFQNVILCLSPVKVVRKSNLPSTKDVSMTRKIRQFYDAKGRERYFRGQNVVYKGAPWMPITDHFDREKSFSRQDWTLFKALGMNIVRLGIMWPGVEPVRGVYDRAYLSRMRELVQNLIDFDIYVLLDMHQDTFSEKFCGEGVPAWAAIVTAKKGFPHPVNKPFNLSKDGFPSKEDCSIPHKLPYELTAAHASAVQNLYDNHDGLLDSFANFWKEVASTFKDLPNVIGYNLINEPFAGNTYSRPWLLTPAIADRFNLQHVFERVQEEIRKVDRENMIFFEGVTWENTVGFTRVPGGAEYRNRSVLSFHHYDFLPFATSSKTSYFFRALDLRRLDCGGMITETETNYDVTAENVGEKITYAPILSRKEANRRLFSVIGWPYKRNFGITGDHATILREEGFHVPTAKVMSWPFPPAVAGRLDKIQFDNDTSIFEMSFHIDTELDDPTEIVFPESLHYPNGFKVEINPPSALSYEVQGTNQRQSKLDDMEFLKQWTGLSELATKILLKKTPETLYDQAISVKITPME